MRPKIIPPTALLLVCLAGWRWAVTADPRREPLDPAGWGSDHVGQGLPEFIESGECLFCHRHDVGRSWSLDRHALTLHDALPELPAMRALAGDPEAAALAPEVKHLLGDGRANRFARRSERYGRLDLLSVRAHRGRGDRWRLTDSGDPHWDTEKFNARCAGCHATAVDPETQAFSLPSLDCFVCHGDAPVEHANDPTRMPLAKKRGDPPRVVTAICAQCHVRFGRSRSSGRPFPNNFVAGDNLFRDFEIDWAKADDPEVNPADRHVLANVRDVVVRGDESLTCLSCHSVHGHSTQRHRQLAEHASCAICHPPGEPKSKHRVYEVHSELCEY